MIPAVMIVKPLRNVATDQNMAYEEINVEKARYLLWFASEDDTEEETVQYLKWNMEGAPFAKFILRRWAEDWKDYLFSLQ